MSYLLVFDSTHAAMAAQSTLASIKPRLIPTPRAITADCGMALRFEAESDQEAISLAQSVSEAKGQAHLYLWPDSLLRDL